MVLGMEMERNATEPKRDETMRGSGGASMAVLSVCVEITRLASLLVALWVLERS